MIWFSFIWFFLGIVVSFFENSPKIFREYNLPLNFEGGYSVPNWRMKQVMEQYAHNEVLVKKLKRNLWISRISSFGSL
jgi:hypothetical protein